MRALLPGILLLASSPVLAEDGDWWLNLHIGSSHSDDGFHDPTETIGGMSAAEFYARSFDERPKTPYNESNFGIGFEYEAAGALGFKAGIYDNSYYETSVYGAMVFHTDYSRMVSASLTVGGVTGYEKLYDSPLVMLAAPAIQINATKHLRAELGYIPSIAESDSVLTLSLGIKFK